MNSWMPEEDIGHKGVVENLINTFKADSLEELAEKLQCLDIDDQPIKGLYAIGNLAGNFYGGVDYPLDDKE